MKILDWIVSVALRIVFGIVGIYLTNYLCLMAGQTILVGLNTWTVGCVGVLGMPGFAMLYGLAALTLL